MLFTSGFFLSPILVCVWQQDSAPCHTIKRTQCWLWDNFWDYINPNILLSNSPYWNYLDYYRWDEVEQKINKNPCNTKDELKARVTAAFTNLKRRQLERLVKEFKVVSRSMLKLMASSLNEFNQSYFKIFSYNFGN